MWHSPELLGLSGALGGRGVLVCVGGHDILSCALLCVRWAICCVGFADVHCDFLVSLVGVVSSCPGGLFLLWMMSYVCRLMASRIVIRVCN